MKLNGSVLVAVAMMIGSIGAIGCKSNDQAAKAEANPAEQPAAEPAKTETPAAEPAKAEAKTDESNAAPSSDPGVEQDSVRVAVFVPFGPPAERREAPGRAPSARHFWVNGHYKYVNGRYIWVGGHWDQRRNGRTYVQPHYDRVDGRWRFVPGHWA